MHWLLLLALLSSTGDLKNVGGSNDALSRAAETSLRRQLGPVRSLRVDAARKSTWSPGDFEHFNVSLDGASLDSLLALADRAETKRLQSLQSRQSLRNNLNRKNNFDLGDIFGGGDLGDLGDLGTVFGGDLGSVLGGVLGGQKGRIGSVKLNLTNFTLQGVGYERLDANLGEIQFDFVKALQGDFDIKSWQPGTLNLQVRADQAQRFIVPRLPSIKDAYLKFDGGRAWVGGKANYYGLSLPFQAGGMLSVQSNQVRAENLALSVANLRLPGFIVDELTKGVNPLYDFDPQRRWPVAVNLQTAGAQGDRLSLSGGLQWIGFNRNNSTAPSNTPVYQPNYQPPYQAPQYSPYPAPQYPAPQSPPIYRAPGVVLH